MVMTVFLLHVLYTCISTIHHAVVKQNSKPTAPQIRATKHDVLGNTYDGKVFRAKIQSFIEKRQNCRVILHQSCFYKEKHIFGAMLCKIHLVLKVWETGSCCNNKTKVEAPSANLMRKRDATAKFSS